VALEVPTVIAELQQWEEATTDRFCRLFPYDDGLLIPWCPSSDNILSRICFLRL
jgi:hypothetical protein